ncbi:MAG: alpha-1,2-fucosyltransferase [Bacteroidaceae bacterium]|nr:alpha-1,2-fucosyltransferase [Bacteroidaceae bacterium]
MLNALSWDLIWKDTDFTNSTCRNFLVVGFWQSSEYVCDRSIFIFQEEKLSEKTKALQQSIEAGNSISLHVRRGDYLSPKNKNLSNGICTIKYYEKAIHHMCAHVEEPIFYVFSDDIPWVRDNLAIHNAVYVSHNQGMDSWQDMYLISKCKHHIIANSTFSWWGAFLGTNQEKIVVCPPKLTNRGDSPDLFPDEWVKIEEL